MKATHLVLAAMVGLVSAPMVASADDNRSTMERVGDYVSDSVLTTRVKAAFATQSELSAIAISVETTDGVVTLTGEVDNDAQVELAEKVASDIDGVRRVRNKLTSREG